MSTKFNSQLLHYKDPNMLEFEAGFKDKVLFPDGRVGVILDRTYFYPTGGGQDFDTGTIGKANVIDVYKDPESGMTVHILDEDVPERSITAKIDASRRLRHKQHHTAQHLLTQSFLQLYDVETVSAHINGYSSSYIDINVGKINKDQLDNAEDLANQIIYENRQVRTYFVSPDDIHRVPLRRPPSVQENIRIVEIDSYDYSACGGTHCDFTGVIGVVKILKSEFQNKKTRIHFVAGVQAMEYFRRYQDIVTELASEMSTHPSEVPRVFKHQIDQLKSTSKELKELRKSYTRFEAKELIGRGKQLGPYNFVQANYENKPIEDIRVLANELKISPNTIATLAAFDKNKIVLIVTCSEDTAIHADKLLNKLLSTIGGRGGGDKQIAQGGGTATRDQFINFFENTRSLLPQLE
jgi:alanyl-tRNA synthetase